MDCVKAKWVSRYMLNDEHSLLPWVRAFELMRAKREREEGSGELCTKSYSVNHSRDHAIHWPTTSMLFPGICNLEKLLTSHLLSTSLYVETCMRLLSIKLKRNKTLFCVNVDANLWYQLYCETVVN